MIVEMALGLLAGGVTGALFLGTLAWTVRRLPAATWPGLLVLASFALRLAGALVVLALLARWSGVALLGGLAGFVVVRVALVRAAGTGPRPVKDA